ncbi:MAG: hypothetical protein IH945_04195 [Armatimonadetes bacterium]|nr:hypothetical protein [Armatimonadota bacterium]
MIQTNLKNRDHETSPAAENKKTGFSTLAALPSNLGAIEAGMRFANGTTPFIAILGSSGWGKSHLLESVRSYMVLQGTRVGKPVAALAYASSPECVEEALPLLLDDVQDAHRDLRTRHELRRLLEQRVRSSRPTMLAFSDEVSQKQVCSFLPFSREWGIQTIGAPTVAERQLVVRQIASAEDVRLSSPLVCLLSRHLFGNGRSILGAVHTLKLVRADWSDRQNVCEACGLLMPYIHGENGWDPRDVVVEAVSRTRVEGATGQQVCAYLLLAVFRLNEYDTATFLGESPSKVYTMANEVKRRLEDPRLGRSIEKCQESVVRMFDSQ